MTEFLQNTPDKKPVAHFAFAHGAGAPMDSSFMDTIADGLALKGILVSRFEFPYMALRRVDGKCRGPGNAVKLVDFRREIVRENVGDMPLFIGGKSMGGRIATMIADEPGISGIICFGYPFHPPGKPEKLRTDHLETMKVPILIIQGERDPFGKPEEVSSYKLSKQIEVAWVPDGDHSLKPRKKSGVTEEENLQKAIKLVVDSVARTER